MKLTSSYVKFRRFLSVTKVVLAIIWLVLMIVAKLLSFKAC